MADDPNHRPRVVLDTNTLLQAIPTKSRFRDPDDDKSLDAAVAGCAEWIVREDTHFDDLAADSRLLVRPLDPRDFIELLRRLG